MVGQTVNRSLRSTDLNVFQWLQEVTDSKNNPIKQTYSVITYFIPYYRNLQQFFQLFGVIIKK